MAAKTVDSKSQLHMLIKQKQEQSKQQEEQEEIEQMNEAKRVHENLNKLKQFVREQVASGFSRPDKKPNADRSPGSEGDSGSYEHGDGEEHLAKALSLYQRKVDQKHKIALERLEASNMHLHFKKKVKEMGGYGVAHQKSSGVAT